jgi:membrane-associated protease RseP (regulator of RpoE activity)
MTREYSSISVETTLNSGINTTATTIVLPSVGAATALLGGVSLAPGNVDIFTVAIDVDTINEEIVYVTGVSGDTLTISRGQAGTGTPGVSGIAHNAGASIKHVLTSSDLIYFNTAIQPDTLTAKGDIYAASAAGTVGRVGVGTNGQVLTADSSQTRGLGWSSVSPRIGQVLTTTITTGTVTTVAGFVDVAGLSVTITPTSATSKIFVTVNCGFACFQGTTTPTYSVGQFRLVRASTDLLTGLIGIYKGNESGWNNYQVPVIQWVDSPATTSAITYKVQVNNPFIIQSVQANTNSNAQITVMEILV